MELCSFPMSRPCFLVSRITFLVKREPKPGFRMGGRNKKTELMGGGGSRKTFWCHSWYFFPRLSLVLRVNDARNSNFSFRKVEVRPDLKPLHNKKIGSEFRRDSFLPQRLLTFHTP